MSKTAKSWQSYGNGHLPYHCSCYFLARALVYDVACEFACAITMHRNNWCERRQLLLRILTAHKNSRHVIDERTRA